MMFDRINNQIKKMKKMPKGALMYIWSSEVVLPQAKVDEIEDAILQGDFEKFLYCIGILEACHFGSIHAPMFAYTNKGVCVPLSNQDAFNRIQEIDTIVHTK